MSNSTNKIDSLQALRAFSATSVMLFHGTGIISSHLNYVFLENFFSAGFSGVDIFFVLSGFIIYYTSTSKKSTVMAFLTKRLLRIYPVYWVVTLLLVFFYFLSPSLEQAHRGQLDVIWGSLLLLPQEFMVSGIAWTLSYEIIFYLMFALTFFRSPSLFVVTFSLWVVAILTAALLGFKIGVYELDALLNPVIINFAFGCFAAFLYKRYPTIKHWHWPIWSGAALFATSWLLTHQDFIETGGPIRVLCFGLPSALFIYGVLYAPVRVPRLLTHLGDASYSLYLLHGSVLSVLLKLVLKVKADSYLDNFTGSLLLFVFTLLASSIFYLLLEKPLTKTLYNRFAKRESNPPLKKVVPA